MEETNDETQRRLEYSKDILFVTYKNPKSAIEKAFSLFQDGSPNVLEIGGGNTIQTTLMALGNPDVNFITTDIYADRPGVPEYAYNTAQWYSGKLLAQVNPPERTRNLSVLRVSADDALQKIAPDKSINKILIVHPELEVLNSILTMVLRPNVESVLRPDWEIIVKPYKPISQNKRTEQLLRGFMVGDHLDELYGVNLSEHVPKSGVSNEHAISLTKK